MDALTRWSGAAPCGLSARAARRVANGPNLTILGWQRLSGRCGRNPAVPGGEHRKPSRSTPSVNPAGRPWGKTRAAGSLGARGPGTVRAGGASARGLPPSSRVPIRRMPPRDADLSWRAWPLGGLEQQAVVARFTSFSPAEATWWAARRGQSRPVAVLLERAEVQPIEPEGPFSSPGSLFRLRVRASYRLAQPAGHFDHLCPPSTGSPPSSSAGGPSPTKRSRHLSNVRADLGRASAPARAGGSGRGECRWCEPAAWMLSHGQSRACRNCLRAGHPAWVPVCSARAMNIGEPPPQAVPCPRYTA